MSLSAVFPASAQPSDFLPPGAVGRKDTSVTSDETQHVAVLPRFFLWESTLELFAAIVKCCRGRAPSITPPTSDSNDARAVEQPAKPFWQRGAMK